MQGQIQKIQKEGAESLPRIKTSITTTLKGRLEGLGSYKNVLKIQEKKGARPPRRVS